MRWQPHLEVWLLAAGVIGAGLYAAKRIGPQVVHDRRPVTRGQALCFWAGVVVLLLASDWPVHDLAEERLYSVHMVQHLLLTFVMPPLFLMATPTWLARLVVGEGQTYRAVRRLAHPVVAAVVFNAVVIVSHWPKVVNLSVEHGLLHYGMHVAIVAAALVMWLPVCGPLPELRLSRPAQMIYLFVQSIVPTVPAAWLVFADGAVYSAYADVPRTWGLSVTDDQQAAGVVMKVIGGFYLWTIIAVKFFRWAAKDAYGEMAVEAPKPLLWDQVERELERLGPGPPER